MAGVDVNVHMRFCIAEREHPAVTPAILALAFILQAYTGPPMTSSSEATLMDRRMNS